MIEIKRKGKKNAGTTPIEHADLLTIVEMNTNNIVKKL